MMKPKLRQSSSRSGIQIKQKNTAVRKLEKTLLLRSSPRTRNIYYTYSWPHSAYPKNMLQLMQNLCKLTATQHIWFPIILQLLSQTLTELRKQLLKSWGNFHRFSIPQFLGVKRSAPSVPNAATSASQAGCKRKTWEPICNVAIIW